MHPVELSALFQKANRFLSKESVKKEKDQIKKEIKEQVVLEGPKNKNPEDNSLASKAAVPAECYEDEETRLALENQTQSAPSRLEKFKQTVREE